MNMKLPRRRAPIGVVEMERRILLSGSPTTETATWIGQDGHDLVGPSSIPGPDQVQDMHFALSGLPADRTITAINMTGYQSGQWRYNGPPGGSWAAALVRTPGATTADIYVEPYQVETGRYFTIVLTYDDNTNVYLTTLGGTADPNLRMPGQSLTASWLGQDGQDWTGPGASVGPDGFQDVHLALSKLTSGVAIVSASVTASGGQAWAFGPNPNLLPDAELFRRAGDPTQADVDFSPGANLAGQTLTLTVNYANGKSDSATLLAGPTDPGLRTPAPTPLGVTLDAFAVGWAGQDGLNLTGPGDVHLALSGLPAGRSVASAQLSDGTQTTWNYAKNGIVTDPYALPMAFRPSATDPSRADVAFPPIRDESSANLTLRLVLDDGSVLVETFRGGASDPGLRAPDIAATAVIARPGDVLNALANQYGSVHLAAGTYPMSSPLVLNRPVSITADPGATLLFAQGAADPTWTSAIKIQAGHTTLDGFAVRFAGPIRWTDGISYGPAVIGTTDNFDRGPAQAQLKVDITLTHLDLVSPPAATDGETAPSLIRVVSAQNGEISGNVLKGGTTEFIGGPWRIVGNTYQGTVPGTVTSTAFAGHYTHDVLIANNLVEPVGPSGKTWRFLVLTQSGIGDAVENNTVIGVGPRDDDTIVNPNASEVVLTEAYTIKYEGAPASISTDGQVVQIYQVQAGVVQAGDVLAILAGPEAGQWRRIVQALNPTTFLLDRPIDPGDTAVSVASGFVGESFEGNTIDTRGSSTAFDLVLAGNHFGTQVVNNHLLGGARGFWISAYASETPSIYGWTHAPVLGVTIQGNTIEDTIEGGLLVVEHNSAIKTNVGRVYLSATLTDNLGVWTDAFVAQHPSNAPAGPLRALTVGMAPSNDPGELVVNIARNQVQGPASVISGATLWTASAVVNGQAQKDLGTSLPAVPDTPPDPQGQGPGDGPVDPGGGQEPPPPITPDPTPIVDPIPVPPPGSDPAGQDAGGNPAPVIPPAPADPLTPPPTHPNDQPASVPSSPASPSTSPAPPSSTILTIGPVSIWNRHPNPFRRGRKTAAQGGEKARSIAPVHHARLAAQHALMLRRAAYLASHRGARTTRAFFRR